MTNKEAIISAIGIPGWQEGAVLKALVDFDIVPDVVYVKASATVINQSALQVLRAMLSIASIQEGGYSIQYSIEGVKLQIAALELTLGITGQPKLRNKSNIW